MSSSGRVVKRVILGRAMRSDRLGETLLPKRLALPVFASDALSSVAYAPDEILLTLGLAGGALAATHSWEIALAVVVYLHVVLGEMVPKRSFANAAPTWTETMPTTTSQMARVTRPPPPAAV